MYIYPVVCRAVYICICIYVYICICIYVYIYVYISRGFAERSTHRRSAGCPRGTTRCATVAYSQAARADEPVTPRAADKKASHVSTHTHTRTRTQAVRTHTHTCVCVCCITLVLRPSSGAVRACLRTGSPLPRRRRGLRSGRRAVQRRQRGRGGYREAVRARVPRRRQVLGSRVDARCRHRCGRALNPAAQR
jgi:hypothetical protein